MSFMDTVKGWFGKAKETASDVAEKAAPAAEKAWDKTKDVAGDVAEKAGDMAEKAWDKAKDVAGDLKDKLDGEEESAAAESEGDAESAEEAKPEGENPPTQ
jgi:hypothetical protein